MNKPNQEPELLAPAWEVLLPLAAGVGVSTLCQKFGARPETSLEVGLIVVTLFFLALRYISDELRGQERTFGDDD